MMRFLAALALALSFGAGAMAQPVDTGHLTAELVAEAPTIAPGQTIHVALRQKIAKGWHTYWRNAGDSGEATTLKWTLPAGWKAGEIIWPAPQRLKIGPLLDYGYTGEVLLPVTLTAPANAKVGDTVALTAAAGFLVCEEICVPEDAVLTLPVRIVAQASTPEGADAAAIAKSLAAAPKPGVAAVFQTGPAGVALAMTGAALAGIDAADAYFYPYDSTLIAHSAPQLIERGPQGLTLTITPGYGFKEGRAPQVLAGALVVAGQAYEVSAHAGTPPPEASGLGPPPAKPQGSAVGLGLVAAAGLAFLGGLILNLMPCVFPVLAMKAASLARHGGEGHAAARREGLAFGAGVIVAFLALAGLLIALQAAGAAIGWGFQLQSPPVVAALALLMLVVALNLSGVFEVGASLQGAGSGLAARGGLAGAFFTGALAVVVAAPCTAPFMGPALGWALTQPALAALAVFLALGIGFAAPFVTVAFAPALLKRLPPPGPWMDVFRKALAFPMYAAAGWLVWVLTLQAGDGALAGILAAAVGTGLAAWLAGLAQQRAANGRPAWPLGAAALVAIAAALWLALGPTSAAPSAATGQAQDSADLPAEPFSPERLAELRAAGKPVFVNYTAAWCVSCQVNDRVALSTPAVANAMRKAGAVYLKADWTRKDPVIAAQLAEYGRAGVPLYLVYGAGGREAEVLPSLLTQGIVVQALEKAAKAG